MKGSPPLFIDRHIRLDFVTINSVVIFGYTIIILGGKEMHRLKLKIQVVFAGMLCTVLFFPMPAHAYSEAETRAALGIATQNDINVILSERDVISSITTKSSQGENITHNATTPSSSLSDMLAGSSTEENPSTEEVSESTEITETSNNIFDSVFYADAYPDLKSAYGYNNELLYNHFITVGMTEGRQGSANFNVMVYKEKNPDLKKVFQDNLTEYYNHFVNGGYLENRVAR